jgi:glycosyltransferase involved in cell wall biosynthesis
MRVLLSAYACHPAAGSDDAVAWGWATQLARQGVEVWVLTRELNRPAIEAYLEQSGDMPGLHFAYHENHALMPVLRRLRARFRYFYYYAWQYGAYRLAAGLHQKLHFDVVHHVTWVQGRSPSFMGRLGIPFILGPLAGGEAAPWPLRGVLGLRQWTVDLIRDIWTLLARVDPLVRRTYREATRILVATPDSLGLVPAFARPRARVQLAIAFEPSARMPVRAGAPEAGLKLLYVGRFLGLKGMELGLAAFAQLAQAHPASRLTLVGSGPEEGRWRRLAERLGIADKLEWIAWLPREEVEALYAQYDVMLFPSLHDSGGLVILEAMSAGLPVVCLDLGGPGMIVDETCGIKIEAHGKSRPQVESALGEALLRLAGDESFRKRLGSGAISRSGSYTWNRLFDAVYGEFIDRSQQGMQQMRRGVGSIAKTEGCSAIT